MWKCVHYRGWKLLLMSFMWAVMALPPCHIYKSVLLSCHAATDWQFASTREGHRVPFATAGDCYSAARCPQVGTTVCVCVCGGNVCVSVSVCVCVTDVVLQAPSEVSGQCSPSHWGQTCHLWHPKRHHYQLRQRKASTLLTRVAYYILEEWVSPHTSYIGMGRTH